MRVLFISILLSGKILLANGQSAQNELPVKLATRILQETQQFVYGGDTGQPSEVLAFNLIYRLPDAAKHFKTIYQRSGTAGKLYSLLGLYCLKDKEYEHYRSEFLALKDDHELYVRYGCLASDEKKNDVLKNWIKGYTTGLWYTKIVLTE